MACYRVFFWKSKDYSGSTIFSSSLKLCTGEAVADTVSHMANFVNFGLMWWTEVLFPFARSEFEKERSVLTQLVALPVLWAWFVYSFEPESEACGDAGRLKSAVSWGYVQTDGGFPQCSVKTPGGRLEVLFWLYLQQWKDLEPDAQLWMCAFVIHHQDVSKN